MRRDGNVTEQRIFFRMRDITKNYALGDEEVPILKGINLDVAQGEYLSVLGPSGSGKSTLMNIIGCLDQATSGEYILQDQRIADLDEKELSHIRSREIGFIFQNSQMLPRMDAVKNVELPLIYRNVPAAERKRLSEESLKRVGLEKRMDHKPTEMSGGQQQRVAIARALAAAPPLILADEPTGNLDSKSSREIMEILRKLHTEGRTVILITHDDKIAQSAKRIIRIMDGKIESDSGMADKKSMEEENGEE